MIILSEYFMGRDKQYPDELTDTLHKNAEQTVASVNVLLGFFGEHRKVNSGWRPAAINASTPGAAAKSKHMTCQACDLDDPEGDLDEWCLAHPDILTKIGLWQEHPASTKGWCHVQTVQYRSWRPGKPRWFYP